MHDIIQDFTAVLRLSGVILTELVYLFYLCWAGEKIVTTSTNFFDSMFVLKLQPYRYKVNEYFVK